MVLGESQRKLVLAVALVGSTLTTACDRPVTCTDFKVEEGSRPSITTFSKPVTKRKWSSCSDGKTRSVTCTTGHWSAWKCMCAIGGVDKIESRKDADSPDDRDGATAFANATCHWKLR
jgi:hypothetical protein